MHENNFEKQVQQKTDELKLRPSDEVWQKIAVVIGKRKTDRRIFAILLLLLLFTGTVIFIVWDNIPGRKINKTISEKTNPVKETRISEHTGDSNTTQVVAVDNNPGTGSKSSAGERINIKDMAVSQKSANQPKTTPVHLRVNITSPGVVDRPGNNDDNAIESKDADANVYDDTKNADLNTRQKTSLPVIKSNPTDLPDKIVGSNDDLKTKTGKTTEATNDEAIIEQLMDTVSNNEPAIMGHLKDTLTSGSKTGDKKENSLSGSIQSKQQDKWKVGINLSFGAATTQSGYLGVIGLGTNDEKVFDQAQSNTGTGGQVPGTAVVPSKIKTGTGLVTGIFIQKNISKKTHILLGLNYKIYNSSMMTGNRIDSGSYFAASNSVYRNGNTNEYNNHFHFLELPVMLGFKLGMQNKVPLYLNTGLSIARLVGSNALQFEPLSGSYYTDNSLFNKTLVNVSAGLLISLSGNAKNPFLIGPEINFSLTKMASSGLYKDRHYSYFGIQVQKTIGIK